MKKNTKKNSRSKKTEEFLQYRFTPEELQVKGKELAEQNSRKDQLALQKKEVVKDFDTKISTCDSKMASLSSHINTGVEYREVPCLVYFNNPEVGRKTVERQDTMETVRVVDMTDEEKQEELDFAESK